MRLPSTGQNRTYSKTLKIRRTSAASPNQSSPSDSTLFKSPLSPAEYQSPVLKRKRLSRGVPQSPISISGATLGEGFERHTPSSHTPTAKKHRSNSITSPQDESSRDSGVCMETDAMSPLLHDLITPEVKGHKVTPVKSVTSRRTLFGGELNSNQPMSSDLMKLIQSPKFKLFGSLHMTPTSRKRSHDHGIHSAPTTPCSAQKAIENKEKRHKKVAIRRHHSDSDAIKSAVNRSEQDGDLIGDFSRCHQLPSVDGTHRDLKYVTPATVANIVSGGFTYPANYTIIDCRYPFEYSGGHIHGAINLYTKEQILNFLKDPKSTQRLHRSTEGTIQGEKQLISNDPILIFHCEFSSERAPRLARFLRNQDRLLNAEKYPKLNYPEMYMLQGGYKDFYHQFPGLCDPIGYTPMLDGKYTEDLRKFRAKSKSWTAEEQPMRGQESLPIRAQRTPSRGQLTPSRGQVTPFRERGNKLRL